MTTYGANDAKVFTESRLERLKRVKPSLSIKLNQLAIRLEELNALLGEQDVTRDLDRYRALTREHAEITPVVALYRDWERSERDLAAAEEMLADPETRSFADDESKAAKSRMEELEARLQQALLPRDPNDDRNVFLEIRAGTGGDESALFAGELFRMYARFAERNKWQVELISESPGDMGGYKEVIARMLGAGSPAEIRIDTFRASGAGGQHVNKTDSAVRITHIPTGLVVECQDDRSQHRNRAQAMAVLASRLLDRERQERQKKEAATRKGLIGSGDRSERIRTYNFPQGRVTDHRINLTLYKIDAIMDGDLFELTQALAQEFQAEQLAALGEEA